MDWATAGQVVELQRQLAEAQGQLRTLIAREAVMWKALSKFGTHYGYCAIRLASGSCTCGLAKVLLSDAGLPLLLVVEAAGEVVWANSGAVDIVHFYEALPKLDRAVAALRREPGWGTVLEGSDSDAPEIR